jgi:trimethylamine--corrinoid protein Co-methyltransferase
MTDALCGANIIHDLGYLESGMTGSLAQLVICNEILGWLSHFVRGVDTSEEAIALDLIDEIGPDGQFLDSDHTYDHFRERWYPGLLDRQNHDGWLASGGKTLTERAADRVQTILAEHVPEPLPGDAAEKIREIVERADRNA